MFAAAYLPRRFMLIPVLATIAVVDAYQGTYGLIAMSIVYTAHLLAAGSISSMLSKVGFRTVVVTGILNAVVF